MLGRVSRQSPAVPDQHCKAVAGRLPEQLQRGLGLTSTVLQVLVPASQFLRSLVAARLAADVLDVPTVLIARTDAHSAQLLTSDIDEIDKPFCTGERTPEGFFCYKAGVEVRGALHAAHWSSCMLRECARCQAARSCT